ncbi:hypothetical protein [Natronolimnobius baerhuensis]|uniref:Uncharacterized protein n=1 Tax=Natronolimnobius baerhuensis TaxID=253108 RepID=A0A202E4R9_9EURY|nr:hypothetical protein [Natronolimnobius baerhuensis]OVE83204.1 hypothetical protein B2G88_17510 [Natronolimnobius baerhuensis]
MTDPGELVNKPHARLLARMLDAATGWDDDDMPDEVVLLATQAGVNEATLRKAAELSDCCEVNDE